jgi:hypothetical protein
MASGTLGPGQALYYTPYRTPNYTPNSALDYWRSYAVTEQTLDDPTAVNPTDERRKAAENWVKELVIREAGIDVAVDLKGELANLRISVDVTAAELITQALKQKARPAT